MRTAALILCLALGARGDDSAPSLWPVPSSVTYGTTALTLAADFFFSVDESSPTLVKAVERYEALILGQAAAAAKRAASRTAHRAAPGGALSSCTVAVRSCFPLSYSPHCWEAVDA